MTATALLVALAGFTLGSVTSIAGIYVLTRVIRKTALDEPRDQ